MVTAYQNVFSRYEQKYLLSKEKYLALIKLLTPQLTEDKFGRYTIGNIYYDTADFALIRASLEKPVYKEKLRLRSYGPANAQNLVYLELKKKFNRVVHKRRIQLAPREARDYLLQGIKPPGDEQILQEIDWFLKMHRVVPQVYIAYERAAYLSKDDENLRVTFDENIRFRVSGLDLSRTHSCTPLLNTDYILMEIKIPGAMPLWLSRHLTDLDIFPTSFSKYGVCYKEHLFTYVKPKGGICCA